MHAAERDQPKVQAERAAFQAEVAALDPKRLVFVDESGVLTNMVRLYGRAPVVLGALGCEGVAAAMTIAAATDTAIFLAFVDEVLIPELRQSRPDAIVVMDNLSAHQAPAVRQHLEAAGLRLLYLPRYSPDLSPIEPMWSKLKASLRAVAARSLQALETALPQALNRITPNDATGYFRHCGYAK